MNNFAGVHTSYTVTIDLHEERLRPVPNLVLPTPPPTPAPVPENESIDRSANTLASPETPVEPWTTAEPGLTP